jgi:hypothetical protein
MADPLEQLAALIAERKRAREAMLNDRYGYRDLQDLETADERTERIWNDESAWTGKRDDE